MPEAEHAGEELAVVTYSDVGKITSLNSHGVLLLGFRESELIDLDVMTLICPDVFEDSGEDAARQTFGLESRGGASSPTTLGGSGNRSPAALDSPRSPRSSSRPTQSVQQLHTYLRRKTKPSFAAQLHVHKFRVPIPKAARVAKGPKHLTTFACTFSHADGEEMMTSLLLGERVGSPEEESPLREIGDGDCDSDSNDVSLVSSWLMLIGSVPYVVVFMQVLHIIYIIPPLLLPNSAPSKKLLLAPS
jgi:hypothetical protein